MQRIRDYESKWHIYTTPASSQGTGMEEEEIERLSEEKEAKGAYSQCFPRYNREAPQRN